MSEYNSSRQMPQELQTPLATGAFCFNSDQEKILENLKKGKTEKEAICELQISEKRYWYLMTFKAFETAVLGFKPKNIAEDARTNGIIDVVCQKMGIERHLFHVGKSKDYRLCIMLCTYIIRERIEEDGKPIKFETIAPLLGRNSAPAIWHSYNTATHLLSNDRNFKQKYSEIIQELNNQEKQ